MSAIQSPAADIGVFGGSGFYSLLENVQEITLETPYGATSDSVFLAEYAGRRVAFLPRHGRHHTIPPHKINYRANVWAMKSLGVRYLLAPCAVGSLQAALAPEHFVVCDQYVDRTNNRRDTFFDGPDVHHVSSADPYCPHLRRLAVEVIREQGIPVQDSGTLVVIQGPRFSSKAESRWFTQMGWNIVSMTQYPEMMLAHELSLCYTTLSLVTDYDAGLVADVAAVQAHDVLEVLRENTANAKRVLKTMLSQMPATRDCPCADALKYARM